MRILLLMPLLFCSGLALAQRAKPETETNTRRRTTEPTTRQPQKTVKTPEANEEFTRTTSVGITTNTNAGLLGGFAFKTNRFLGTKGWRNQYSYLGVELVNVRHLKERPNQTPTGSRYTFGKQNYLFSLRPQYGREITIFKKNGNTGTQINGILAGGPSIGLVEPYLISYSYGRGRIVTEQYDPVKHTNENAVTGSSGMFAAISKIEPVIGGHLKAALNVELDAFQNSNVGIELGFLAEGYSKQVTIMPLATNRDVFTSGYITLFFGKKK